MKEIFKKRLITSMLIITVTIGGFVYPTLTYGATTTILTADKALVIHKTTKNVAKVKKANATSEAVKKKPETTKKIKTVAPKAITPKTVTSKAITTKVVAPKVVTKLTKKPTRQAPLD